tara:strand:- start:3155 stop:3400 length:246 start_codon:yes stop_codon:yes gene_type:complete
MSDWPGWFYGPNGESAIFKSAGEVPAGWEDAPQKVKKIAAVSEPDFVAPEAIEIVEDKIAAPAPIKSAPIKPKRPYKRKVK